MEEKFLGYIIPGYESDSGQLEGADSMVDSDLLDNEVTDYNFKLYGLADIDALNAEIDDTKLFQGPWWKIIFKIWNKKSISNIGLIQLKINNMLAMSNFDGVVISDKIFYLHELDLFCKTLNANYELQRNLILLGLALFVELAWFYPESVWLYLMIGLSIFSLIHKYIGYSRQKKWVVAARVYINESTYDREVNIENGGRNNQSPLSDTIEFLKFSTEQSKKEWSVRLFDWVANLIKRK
ncbi:MAG: hypothetical protein P8179_08065 [Candidatus Thiodiazotropha sp.]